MVAGRRMGKDGKSVSIDRQPSCNLTEPFDRHRQLHRAAGMGADRLLMKMTDRHPEPSLHHLGQGLRLLQLGRIEIDMGVEIGDLHFGHYLLLAG